MSFGRDARDVSALLLLFRGAFSKSQRAAAPKDTLGYTARHGVQGTEISATRYFGRFFGVIVADCQHVGMRGLVFSSALINGSPNGQCRPDLFFRKKVLWPILAGTNEITFL